MHSATALPSLPYAQPAPELGQPFGHWSQQCPLPASCVPHPLAVRAAWEGEKFLTLYKHNP